MNVEKTKEVGKKRNLIDNSDNHHDGENEKRDDINTYMKDEINVFKKEIKNEGTKNNNYEESGT